MSRRRILAFSFFPAYVPPRNGGVERLFRIYSLLANHFDVTLISSAEVGGHRELVEHSTYFTEIRIPKDAHFEDCYVELSKLSGDGDLSGPALGLANRRHGAIHDEYLARYAGADLIIHDSPFLVECDLFRGFDAKVRIYNSYNFETSLYRSFHSRDGGDTGIEDLVAELERDLCQHSDLITACSEGDRESFVKAFAPIAPIILIPNGFYPQSAIAVGTREPNCIIFLGSNHQPNVDAARRIVDELAPSMPDLEFHLVGSCHQKMRKRNVIAHGVVDGPTKTGLLAKAALAINPVESGSGSSLKIADIAVSGTPLLTTVMGARGFEIEPGRHYFPLRLDNLVGSLESALAHPGQLSAVAERARKHFLTTYAWPAIVQKLVDQIDKLRPLRSAAHVLVVNDYDSFRSVGGGATRTSGLCKGLAESDPVIFLAFNDDGGPTRRVSNGGRILSLLVDKSHDHQARHDAENLLHWMSAADIVNYLEAPKNERLVSLFRCAASICRKVVCEHPYMVSLPRMFDIDFIYSSQNFEYALKTHSLRDHPRFVEHIATVYEAEQVACGASSLIVAVSEDDGRGLSGNYRFTAPIVVIENGSDGPDEGKLRPRKARPTDRRSAIFMGSAHGPNAEAAQWIVTKLAPAMPDVDFAILGAVANNLTGDLAPNIRLIGQVSARVKSSELYAAHVAINPMQSGSGSNVKMADYLQHGLPVVSTTFGARGYLLPADDVAVTDLDAFHDEVRSILSSAAVRPAACVSRQRRYLDLLSMEAGGRRLRQLIEDECNERPRALYVTFRYNDPPRGGGEFYVDRLMFSLAESGWLVDVVSPEAERISDIERFGARFDGASAQPTRIGLPRVRSAKFQLDAVGKEFETLRKFWRVQPAYEETFVKSLGWRPQSSALAWGWGYPQEDGRWFMTNAGVFAPLPAELSLAGETTVPIWIQFFTESGELLHDEKVGANFSIQIDIPAGFIRIEATLLEARHLDDARPLAAFIKRVALDGTEVTFQIPSEVWTGSVPHLDVYRAHAEARLRHRDPENLRLGDCRHPSQDLSRYVDEHVCKYDLVVTHNAVFGTATHAIAAAKRNNVPSINVPHLHLEDDFYHFPDVLASCADASITLACPSLTKRFLEQQGVSQVRFFTPGVDVQESFSQADAREFRELLGSDDEFVLILGRKTLAKGYDDVIRAVRELGADAPLVVMIGPDDDQLTIKHEDAIYLGYQSRSVVRGALLECIALINMSRSESFGMVVLEAGLARKPVIANPNCAAFVDLIEDGVNGYLARPHELKCKLAAIIADEDLRKRMGEAGHAAARTFDWRRIEREFIQLSNELIGAA